MTAAASHDGVTSVPPCSGCVLCAAEVWTGASVSTVPCAPPVAPVDLSELASDLRTLGLHTAARLVTEGRREYADTIASEVLAEGANDVTFAQVTAWGEGRDAAVIASNIAWRRDQCEACALDALATGDTATRCSDCRAEVCA